MERPLTRYHVEKSSLEASDQRLKWTAIDSIIRWDHSLLRLECRKRSAHRLLPGRYPIWVRWWTDRAQDYAEDVPGCGALRSSDGKAEKGGDIATAPDAQMVSRPHSAQVGRRQCLELRTTLTTTATTRAVLNSIHRPAQRRQKTRARARLDLSLCAFLPIDVALASAWFAYPLEAPRLRLRAPVIAFSRVLVLLEHWPRIRL
jgi:hypothetical protein